jgi:hypothetical protein
VINVNTMGACCCNEITDNQPFITDINPNPEGVPITQKDVVIMPVDNFQTILGLWSHY